MRYASDRKRDTHERIVAEAARLFRVEGYKGAGVDAVMKSAGLTAGGFYAHFADKDDLLAQAMEHCARHLSPGIPDDLKPRDGEAIGPWLDRYLSVKHRDKPGIGCILPTLAGEIPRQSKAVRSTFTRVTQSYLGNLADRIPGKTPAARADQAIAVLATVAGAMLLARAVDDETLSRRILRVARTAAEPRRVAAKRNQRKAANRAAR